MSKKAISNGSEGEQEIMSKAFFGTLDSSLFLAYSIVQFFGSNVGDKFDKKVVLSISFLIQSVFFFIVEIAGFYGFFNKVFFLFCFLMIGAAQSICFPCLVSIVGGWFSKSSRGFITGSWGTSTNFGNIVGIQLSAIILHLTNDHWYILMLLITLLFVINACLILTVFTPHPLQQQLIIELDDLVDNFKERGEKLS